MMKYYFAFLLNLQKTNSDEFKEVFLTKEVFITKEVFLANEVFLTKEVLFLVGAKNEEQQ